MKKLILVAALFPMLAFAGQRTVSANASARGASIPAACGAAESRARINLYCMGSLGGTSCQSSPQRSGGGYLCYASCYATCRTQDFSPSPRR